MIKMENDFILNSRYDAQGKCGVVEIIPLLRKDQFVPDVLPLIHFVHSLTFIEKL